MACNWNCYAKWYVFNLESNKTTVGEKQPTSLDHNTFYADSTIKLRADLSKHYYDHCAIALFLLLPKGSTTESLRLRRTFDLAKRKLVRICLKGKRDCCATDDVVGDLLTCAERLIGSNGVLLSSFDTAFDLIDVLPLVIADIWLFWLAS